MSKDVNFSCHCDAPTTQKAWYRTSTGVTYYVKCANGHKTIISFPSVTFGMAFRTAYQNLKG